MATRTIVHFGELPASSGGKQPGLLFPPAWMGPTRANNDALVERAALAMKSRFNAAHAALFS